MNEETTNKYEYKDFIELVNIKLEDMYAFNWVLDSVDSTEQRCISGYVRGHKLYKNKTINTYHLHRDKTNPSYTVYRQLEELFFEEEKRTHYTKENNIDFDLEKFSLLC